MTVLESRDRLGGRIHTDYSFGSPVDMGASWYVQFVLLYLLHIDIKYEQNLFMNF